MRDLHIYKKKKFRKVTIL